MKFLDVSVVVPCFNASATLIRSLESVACQIEMPREVIVVDDGSEHSVSPLVEIWAEKVPFPVHLVEQSNAGAPAARNVGVKIARGRYIAFLDADDVWFPDKLRIQYAVMERNELTVSGHRYTYHAKDPKLPVGVEFYDVGHVRFLSKWRFALGNPLFTPTVMVRRRGFGGFDERFRRVDDYKAWVENFSSGRCGLIDVTLAAGFKPPIGHSGLTGSVDLMHRACLDVLSALFRERHIGMFFYATAVTVEYLKFCLRVFRFKIVKNG